MSDKNMKEKMHDAAENIKEKAAELKGEMKVKAKNVKHGVQKGMDSAKQKGAELKGEMKEHAHEAGKKLREMKEKIAKKSDHESHKEA